MPYSKYIYQPGAKFFKGSSIYSRKIDNLSQTFFMKGENNYGKN